MTKRILSYIWDRIVTWIEIMACVLLLTSDYQLQSASPAIDTGVALGSAYATDYAGRDQRRYGRGWEIGAYAMPAAAVPGGM